MLGTNAKRAFNYVNDKNCKASNGFCLQGQLFWFRFYKYHNEAMFSLLQGYADIFTFRQYRFLPFRLLVQKPEKCEVTREKCVLDGSMLSKCR